MDSQSMLAAALKCVVDIEYLLGTFVEYAIAFLMCAQETNTWPCRANVSKFGGCALATSPS